MQLAGRGECAPQKTQINGVQKMPALPFANQHPIELARAAIEN